MALADFIPQIWAARFTDSLERTRVYGASVNQRYQVDARGNVVKIPTFSQDVNVGNYQVNTDIAPAQVADGDNQDLPIDQQKYFHVYVDDITRVQSQPDVMSEFTRRAGVAIAETQDSYLLGRYVTGIAAGRTIKSANAAAATVKTILEAVVDLKTMMTRAHIPTDGRWMAVAPEFIAAIEKHFLTTPAPGIFAPATADQIVRNGFAGRLLDFDLRVTTEVHTTGNGAARKWQFIASQGDGAVTMAEQISELEAYRPELRFGEAVKGLYVYGALAAEKEKVFALEIDDSTSN